MIDTGISVYAGLKEYTIEENVKYLKLAKDLGCKYVFSSAHIKEAKSDKEELQSIIDECNKLGLCLSLDVSKPMMDKFDIPKGVFALRLDYGFSDEEIIELSHNAPYLVELNASTLSKEHIQKLIDNGINKERARFTFNFYPKLYSGHDILDVYAKASICNEVGIYVGAFIPSHTGFRPPMYEGLPTVESHRHMLLDNAIEELKACGIKGIYFGDAYASCDEIKTLNIHSCDEIMLKFIPKNDEIIAVESLRALNGKPVWDENRGWGIVNGVQDYVIFMDGSKIVLAEAMNLRAMVPAFSMGYSPTTKPISYEDLIKFKSIWVKPITPDSFLQDELTGWYEVHDFYIQNQYGTRFLFDTYGTRWLAFEMEF